MDIFFLIIMVLVFGSLGGLAGHYIATVLLGEENTPRFIAIAAILISTPLLIYWVVYT